MTYHLRDLLQSTELASMATEIEPSVLPSIRLTTNLSDKAVFVSGASRFGGLPNLPPAFAWPKRHGLLLPFVAQINLSEVAAYDIEPILPSTGFLYFFFDVDQFFATWPRERETWQVHYYDGPLSTLQGAVISDSRTRGNTYRPCTLSFSTELTLPHYDYYGTDSDKRLGLSKPLTYDETMAYYHVQDQLAGTIGAKYHTPIHRLLGHADPVQVDMLEECQIQGNKALEQIEVNNEEELTNTSDWRLLLQIDSDANLDTEWGDTGRIYFWIRKKDLERQDFSKTWLILQST